MRDKEITMTRTKYHSERPYEPQVVLQLATERVYRAAIESKGENEKESNIALGILFDARKYVLGTLYPDGPFAEDAKRHALTGHYADLHFEIERQVKAADAGSPICCDCVCDPCVCGHERHEEGCHCGRYECDKELPDDEYCWECGYGNYGCVCDDDDVE